MSYCKHCGKQKQSVATRLFSEETGEREHALACTTQGCYGHCQFYGHDYQGIGLFGFGNIVCKKCGDILPNY